jgi:hypothetical protein
MKVVEYTIRIQAPLEKVWSAMTRTASYPDWNPFIPKVVSKGDVLEIGTSFTLHVRFPNGTRTKSRERVRLVATPEDNRFDYAEWCYRYEGFPHLLGMIRAERQQLLTKLPDGSTQYHTEEAFTGWGLFLAPLKQVQLGFEAQAKALKAYCEGGG